MIGPQIRRSQAVAAARLRDRTFNLSGIHRNTAAKIRTRVLDQLNESRIRRASRDYLAAANQGNRAAQIAAWSRYSALHAKRSPACIARLESKLGTRVRRSIKRGLMNAFLRGAVPTPIVTAAFRFFGLKDA